MVPLMRQSFLKRLCNVAKQPKERAKKPKKGFHFTLTQKCARKSRTVTHWNFPNPKKPFQQRPPLPFRTVPRSHAPEVVPVESSRQKEKIRLLKQQRCERWAFFFRSSLPSVLVEWCHPNGFAVRRGGKASRKKNLGELYRIYIHLVRFFITASVNSGSRF